MGKDCIGMTDFGDTARQAHAGFHQGDPGAPGAGDPPGSGAAPRDGTEESVSPAAELVALAARYGRMEPDAARRALREIAEAGAFLPSLACVDVIEELLAEIDAALTRQMNAIIHHPDFQALESAWRGLRFLVDRVPSGQNVAVQLLDVSMDDLRNDFEDATEIVRSGLYFHVYISQYGQYGGEPVGALIGNYAFTPRPADMRLLANVAAVAAMAHAPFIASVDRSFFGVDSWEELPNLSSPKALFEMSGYASWRSFRHSEDARYVGLTLPRFLLRAPYGPDSEEVTTFRFSEECEETSRFCWGNTAFAFASLLATSFAKYRWCVNIVGEEDGRVPALPTYCYESMGQIQQKIPTEVLISEQREYELSEEGFISLTLLKGAKSCAFFSACSCQAPMLEHENEDREYVLSYNVSRQLPYLFLITRLAHYIKVIQREYIGSWKNAQELERELNQWVGQYVTAMESPDPETRGRRPFNHAEVHVRETDRDIGWYTVELKVRPHFKYMGMSFTLSLTGKLDKQS